MYLKPGMYVKVRENLVVDAEYNGVYFVSAMAKYRGRVFQVKAVENVIYLRNTDWWCWDISMFIIVTPPEAVEARARLKISIYGVGSPGDVIAVKEYDGVIYLTEKYLPMQGALSPDEAELIKEGETWNFTKDNL